MEKKKIKIIIIVLVAFLVIVSLIGGIYYSNRGYDGVPVEKEKEEITESAIKRYLDYIPYAIYDTDTVPYYNKSITVSEVDKNLLINTALDGTSTYVDCEDDCLPKEVTDKHFLPHKKLGGSTKWYTFYPLKKVKGYLKRMYNISDIYLDLYDTFEYTGEEIMYYNEGFLSRITTDLTSNVIHNVDKYETIDEELIIYDYPIKRSIDNRELSDFQNGVSIDYYKLDLKDTDISHAVNNYVLQHKEDFTLFKYTFKKNDTGYYWYSSEVVGDSLDEELTQYQLNKYLNYVPYGILEDKSIPYYNETSNVNDINKKLLISMTLENNLEFIPCEDPNNCLPREVINRFYKTYSKDYYGIDTVGYDYYPASKINYYLKRMYNIDLDSIDLLEYDRWLYKDKEIMKYDNGFLQRDKDLWNTKLNHNIIDYEINNDDLIIYDKVYGEDNGRKYNCLTKEELENIDATSLYKHTFKKNEFGYYWYSTEVVNIESE